MDELVTAIGGVWNDVYLTERLEPGSESLRAAQVALTEAVQAVEEVVRRGAKSESDLAAIVRAWEAIARAQDLVVASQASIRFARQQGEAARLMHVRAQEQHERARMHADRILRWWGRRLKGRGSRPD